MTDALIRRLEHFVRLSRDDKAIISRLASASFRGVEARRDLISEGQPPKAIYVVLDGWACRYKMLEDGRRQIVSLFIPGDICDVHVYVLREMDHSIAALTNLSVAEINADAFEDLLDSCPRLARALWWSELVTLATQREWTVNVGQRTAYERIAHLMCETYLRLEAVGMVDGDGCSFPLVQTDLADATGLTTVHVNRTLQELRRDGLLDLEHRRLTIPDMARLKAAAQFDDNYLHLNREGRHFDANA